MCVLFIEIGLQVLAHVSPRIELLLMSPWDRRVASPTVDDERLGYRPNPLRPDHDRNGFRNPRVPRSVEVVALGDSQTYGTGVGSSDAWPRQLEAVGEATVYNMAFGGYGPVHSLLLWDEALGLEPTVVIEAFYGGNDLYDSFNLVYNLGQLPELKTEDPRKLDAVVAAEATEPIAERVSRMFRMGVEPSGPAEDVHAVRSGPLRTWVADHAKIYGLLRRAGYESTRKREPEPRRRRGGVEESDRFRGSTASTAGSSPTKRQERCSPPSIVWRLSISRIRGSAKVDACRSRPSAGCSSSRHGTRSASSSF